MCHAFSSFMLSAVPYTALSAAASQTVYSPAVFVPVANSPASAYRAGKLHLARFYSCLLKRFIFRFHKFEDVAEEIVRHVYTPF
jgi:hypothetical protein